jgi:predicted site-specific integrase-resolvase
VVQYLGLRKEKEEQGEGKLVVGYHRKSSGTKADLESGIAQLRQYMLQTYGAENPPIFADLASHINFDARKQFMRLLDLVFEGKVGTIVILWKDRLSRLPIHALLEKVCAKFGATIVYVNNSHNDNADAVQEAMNDLLSFSHTVSCRIYSKRSADLRRFHFSDAVVAEIRKGIDGGKSSKEIAETLAKKGLFAETKTGPKPISLYYLNFYIAKQQKVTMTGGARVVVQEFVEKRCKSGDGCRICKKALHKAYVEWCRPQKLTPLSKFAFGKLVQAMGFVAKQAGTVPPKGAVKYGHYWAGLALR